jgi:uracil-DNA glycosylase
MLKPADSLPVLQEQIITCRQCPRLVAHREEIGIIQRRAYRGQCYWSRPVPGFGDPRGRLLIVGLAPGAHGANRTGRLFTGDRSGEFLYRALWQTGFANQPQSIGRDDGLTLHDVYITSALRCVPPDNKPTLQELVTCRPFLDRELSLLPNVQGIVVLGGIALNAYLTVLIQRGCIRSRATFPFGHSRFYRTHPGAPWLLTCYHPSQQNTSTGKLTADMLAELFREARLRLKEPIAS